MSPRKDHSTRAVRSLLRSATFWPRVTPDYPRPSCQGRTAYDNERWDNRRREKFPCANIAPESRGRPSHSPCLRRHIVSERLAAAVVVCEQLVAHHLLDHLLAPAFFAGAFLVLFFATAFLAYDFLAAAFLAGFFLVAALRTAFLGPLFFTEASSRHSSLPRFLYCLFGGCLHHVRNSLCCFSRLIRMPTRGLHSVALLIRCARGVAAQVTQTSAKYVQQHVQECFRMCSVQINEPLFD